jgi:hypothetical protein
MVDFIKKAPQVPVVLASFILWGALARGLPTEATAAEDEAAEDPWGGGLVAQAGAASAARRSAKTLGGGR